MIGKILWVHGKIGNASPVIILDCNYIDTTQPQGLRHCMDMLVEIEGDTQSDVRPSLALKAEGPASRRACSAYLER